MRWGGGSLYQRLPWVAPWGQWDRSLACSASCGRAVYLRQCFTLLAKQF
jgi:hypothetical protein